MTSQYFDCDYELRVGVDKFELANNNIYKDTLDVQDVLVLKDFHIEFRVELTNSSGSNTAQITIYNPPDKIFNGLKKIQGKRPYIQLKAGFKAGKIDQLFVGNVDKVKSVREGINNQITLICSDASFNKREAYTQRTYPAGTAVSTIITDLADDLALAYGFIENISDTIPSNISFSGNSDKILKDVADAFNVQTSVQSGRLFAVRPEEFQSVTIATKVTPETGLVGSITYESNGTELSDDPSITNKEGISFKMLLNGSIIPEGYVEVVSENFNAIYKVTKVVHTGSFEGNDWFTAVTCSGTFTEV